MNFVLVFSVSEYFFRLQRFVIALSRRDHLTQEEPGSLGRRIS